MDNTGEVKWPEYRVIKVDNRLRTKALVPGSSKSAIANATKRATSAVKQLSVEFSGWMREESDRLHTIRNEIAHEGASAERLDRLFTCAHDIKGQALTFGYPLAAHIGKLLSDLIEHAPDPVKIPLAVIDQHVDTIRVIVRQDLKGDDNAQIRNIIKGLNVLNHTTLKKIAKDKTLALVV